MDLVGAGGYCIAYLVAGGIAGMDHIRNHRRCGVVLHP